MYRATLLFWGYNNKSIVLAGISHCCNLFFPKCETSIVFSFNLIVSFTLRQIPK